MLTVIVLDCGSLPLRGMLSRWMSEVKANVFVGNLSARVRASLIDMLEQDEDTAGACVIYSTPAEEPHYRVETIGAPKRSVEYLNGLQVVFLPKESGRKIPHDNE